MWRKGNPCALLVGMKIGTAIVEKIMEGPQKIRNRNTTQQPHLSIYIYIFKGSKNRISKRYLHSHVYFSIIHKSQGLKTT